MRTNTLIIALFFCALFAVSVRAQHWEYVSSLQNEWLQKICTQGLDTVFIVGRDGLIARSTDRAVSWNVQHFPTKANLNDVVFLNHLTGYAVGVGGTMLKTTDGGLNWNSLNSGTTHNLNAIAATGLNNVWAVGDSGTVVYSNNGGNSWEKKDFSTIKRLNDISFRNGTGYIVGNENTCFKSIDVANSWGNYSVKLDYPNAKYNLLSVSQTPNNTVYIPYFSYSAFNTVCRNNESYLSFSGNLMLSFSMLNDSCGYAVSTVVVTTNGYGNGSFNVYKIVTGKDMQISTVGLSNLPQNAIPDDTHSDISVVNDTIGYLVTGKLMYKLTNSGGNTDELRYPSFQSQISIYQENNNLLVKSSMKNMQDVEICNIMGVMVLQKNKLNNKDVSVSIGSLPIGTYLIRTFFSDKSSSVTKWIKQ